MTETILALHERMITDFGGPPGVHDEGLLHSAFERTRNLAGYWTPSRSQ